jgi:hypothetical protein
MACESERKIQAGLDLAGRAGGRGLTIKRREFVPDEPAEVRVVDDV